jgi:hypothetical protein
MEANMAIVIKTKKSGLQYRYAQHSYRDNGKVKTPSIYLGPVRPKRKRRGGFLAGLTLPTFLVGALLVGIKTVKGEMKTRTYKEKPVEPVSVHRARQIAQKEIERLDRHYAIDKTNADTFNASRGRLPKEMFEEYQRGQMAASGAVHAEQERREPPTPMSPDMKAFNDRLAEVRQEQAARAATPSAPAAPQGEEAETADDGEAKD